MNRDQRRKVRDAAQAMCSVIPAKKMQQDGIFKTFAQSVRCRSAAAVTSSDAAFGAPGAAASGAGSESIHSSRKLTKTSVLRSAIVESLDDLFVGDMGSTYLIENIDTYGKYAAAIPSAIPSASEDGN